jgi:hypothetical protein
VNTVARAEQIAGSDAWIGYPSHPLPRAVLWFAPPREVHPTDSHSPTTKPTDHATRAVNRRR